MARAQYHAVCFVSLLVTVGCRSDVNQDFSLLEAPVEGNRVTNPDGFSVIQPPGWDTRNLPGPGARIRFTTEDVVSVITIDQFKTNVDLPADAVETTFQSEPAYLSRLTRSKSPEHPFENAINSTTFEIYFQRCGAWYCINFSSRCVLDEIPESIVQFLETFKCDATV